ncbi:glutamic acid-rich protein-like [Salvia splendens]|uniref:glutamic acid-rich protein-like n=1 Tax=Salvia splendens TaxID=180675 RepID=UPI001C256A25|nr:glutamic acid-rich protein-like [Salvia splendens]
MGKRKAGGEQRWLNSVTGAEVDGDDADEEVEDGDEEVEEGDEQDGDNDDEDEAEEEEEDEDEDEEENEDENEDEGHSASDKDADATKITKTIEDGNVKFTMDEECDFGLHDGSQWLNYSSESSYEVQLDRRNVTLVYIFDGSQWQEFVSDYAT